jgi:hypothetical protein
MDSIRVSEAFDSGSIPDKTTYDIPKAVVFQLLFYSVAYLAG